MDKAEKQWQDTRTSWDEEPSRQYPWDKKTDKQKTANTCPADRVGLRHIVSFYIYKLMQSYFLWFEINYLLNNDGFGLLLIMLHG